MSAEKIKEVKAAVQENAENAADSARDEFDAVRLHLERLVSHHLIPALSNAGVKAEVLKDQAVAKASEVANHVQTDFSVPARGRSPLLTIAISGVVGFILGRLSR
ncbi:MULTISPECIES: hypothetical protein [Acetobacter]|uniref:DUF883 domain-containing protein n=1 Tax=Acetobacter thailandicus TaxID=1502842 RepID=A0ABT3QCM4_9PROT|nr:MULTISPECIES: hypothetical protein [Acetobacter]MBS0961024.1 hypothetical protein [Acetobacter thailandicus]MBS0981377.1 hypothetical protein [Acetobacter thailandicus]MBS0986481.1 hypothetical protein [Acetobacter thailandicus]MBS1003972.1 hypothetical protein [Acetobacter thailandicus]MCX2562979.1 hypothetical protein [Acetobacter thailandicus]